MSDRPIVIGYDGSPASEHAIRSAAELLGRRPAVVVTVWEPGLAYAAAIPTSLDLPAAPVDVGTATEIDEAQDRRAHRLAEQGTEIARAAGFDARAHVVADESNVAETLVEVAAANGAAAIVVGSRGITGLRARLVGSTSSGVLRHAHCPVVVVHEAPEGD